MALFVLFYVLAAQSYPGGSAVNPMEEGFSLRYNYLCDLLDTETIGGSLNTARHWARAGLLVLCVGLTYLWYRLGIFLPSPQWQLRAMRISALLAFGSAGLLAIADHDITVRIAGLFGIITLILTLKGLWRAKRMKLLGFGIWCLLTFLINYLLYETGSFYRVLPLIQKVTFLSFLGWFAAITISCIFAGFRMKQVENRLQKIGKTQCFNEFK
jgi:hypothetical protein